MQYNANINGIDVEAVYTEGNIKEIFKPLLEKLAEKRQAEGRRILAMIAAPPGAGKSTLVSFLEAYSKEICPHLSVQASTLSRMKPRLTGKCCQWFRSRDPL